MFMQIAVIFLLGVFNGTGLGPTPEDTKRKPEQDKKVYQPDEILKRMGNAYANCRTYRDTGRVTTIFITGKRRHAEVKDFESAFVRPDQFRFEYREEQGGFVNQRYIIWRKGESVKSYWTIKPEIRVWETLSMATAAATGVSAGTAHTIPTLLMPHEISGRKLTELTDLSKLDDGVEREIPCYRIRGMEGDRPMTLWIEKQTFLLWRIDSGHKFPDFRTEVTTTYEPVSDDSIEKKSLKFNPPED